MVAKPKVGIVGLLILLKIKVVATNIMEEYSSIMTSSLLHGIIKFHNKNKDCLTPKLGRSIRCSVNIYSPALHGKRQGSICHDEKVAYRPLIIW